MFCAAIVRGFSGFGDALVFLPLANILLTPQEALAIFMAVAVIGPLPMLSNFKADARKAILMPIGGMMLAFMPIGFYLQLQTEPWLYRSILTVIALVFVMISLLPWHWRFPTTRITYLLIGAIAGVFGAFSGVIGVFLIFYFLNTNLKTPIIRAQGFYLLYLFDILLLTFLTIHGDLRIEHILTIGVLTLTYILGSRLGAKLFAPHREALFRQLGLLIIALSGIVSFPWTLFISFS